MLYKTVIFFSPIDITFENKLGTFPEKIGKIYVIIL